MKPEEFDKLLREVAEEAQFQFEQERWEAAKAMLPQKKKRRWLPFLFLGLAMTLLLLITPSSRRSEAILASGIDNNSPSAISASRAMEQDTESINSEASAVDAVEMKSINYELRPSSSSSIPTVNDIKTRKTPPVDVAKSMQSSRTTRPFNTVFPLPVFLPSMLSSSDAVGLGLDYPDKDKEAVFKKWALYQRSGVGFVLPSQAGGILSSGVSLQKYFGNGLFISFNPNLSVSFSRGGNEKLYKRTIYGLEAHDAYYNIRPDYIVSIQLPLEIGLNHHWGRFGAGLNSEYLLGAYGQITPVAFQDDQWQSIAPGTNGKINNRHSQRWRFGPVISYAYPFTSNLDIGLEGGYWTTRLYQRGNVSSRSGSGEPYLKVTFNYSIL